MDLFLQVFFIILQYQQNILKPYTLAHIYSLEFIDRYNADPFPKQNRSFIRVCGSLNDVYQSFGLYTNVQKNG